MYMYVRSGKIDFDVFYMKMKGFYEDVFEGIVAGLQLHCDIVDQNILLVKFKHSTSERHATIIPRVF